MYSHICCKSLANSSWLACVSMPVVCTLQAIFDRKEQIFLSYIRKLHIYHKSLCNWSLLELPSFFNSVRCRREGSCVQDTNRPIYRLSNNIPNIFARVTIPRYNLFKYLGLYIKIPVDKRDSHVFVFLISFSMYL